MQTVSRAVAAANGATQYFTGKPCKNGHTAYRYVQSGTCATCIAEATKRSRGQLDQLLHADRQARREHVVDLVEVRVRCYPEDAQQVRDVAAAFCLAAYPTLTREDVQVRAAPTDHAGGTDLYRVRVPLEYAQMVRDTASALLNAHRVDLGGFHAAQIAKAAHYLPPAPAAPAWRFQ